MTPKAKLVYILHEIAIGGAEVAFISALPHLVKEFDLRVFVLHRGDRKLIDSIPSPLRKHIVFCNIPLATYPLYITWLAVRVLRFRPRYLICSLWRSHIVGALVKWFDKRIRFYPFIHNSAFFHPFDRYASRWAMQVANAIFVDSQSAANFVTSAGRIDRKRIAVISFITEPGPISVPVYDFHRKRFLFIGRIHPVKQVPTAVRTISWLRKQGVDAYLDIYGRDDGDTANVMQAISSAGMGPYVELKGELLPSVRRKALLRIDYPFYLQLSAVEGMAMSAMEAMQAGKVCIMTAVGEIPHYATDGQSAIFVDHSSIEAWDRSMRRVLYIINDAQKCNDISRAAHRAFRERPLFKDSLVAAIRMEGGGRG